MLLPPRCPRVSPGGPLILADLGEAGPRLGPWYNNIEEQATEGHTDRERIWQF
jgi:hypothetical protein